MTHEKRYVFLFLGVDQAHMQLFSLSSSPVRPIEARFELLHVILLYGCFPIRWEPQINKVPNLKSTLHPVFICLYFLLILCHVQMILELSKYILAHLDPIMYHGCSTVSKYNLHKSEEIIIVQSSEMRHTNEYVVSGVVEILTPNVAT
jgi:hypothetical protein